MNSFDRSKLLIGEERFNKLKNSSVVLFGVGGVGGFVAEALIRSGVGKLTIFDNDVVSRTNLNRQIIATENTIGYDKVVVMKDRLLSINPSAIIDCKKVFLLPNNIDEYDFRKFDYVIDAIDTISTKLAIIERATKNNIPIISCMGTAGKLDPTKLKVADISETKNCPLARVMRKELKKLGKVKVKTIFSEEEPLPYDEDSSLTELKGESGRKAPPSMVFVPGTAGLIIASEVVKDIISL